MNCVWLCSWYPNEIDPNTGNFIKRQAMAVAEKNPIALVHVVPCTYTKYIKKQEGYITEHIYYFKQRSKIVNIITFFLIHKHFFNWYKQEVGKIDLVHAQIPIKSGIVAWWWKKKYKIPYVLTEHYGIYNPLVIDPFIKRSIWFKWFTKIVIQEANLFLPVSKSLALDINNLVVKKECIPIPNVVNERIFNYSPIETTSKFRFIHISNMIPLKRTEEIIKASTMLCAERNDFELVVIGNMSENIKQYVQQNPVDEKVIHFKHNIPYIEVSQHLKKAHCLVLYSTTESQSCVVLESLCAGRPVISSAVGGVVELIDETNGILVPVNDIQVLVQAMNNMIDHYSNYDKEKIAKAASAKYSYDSVGNKIVALYHQVLNK